MKYLKPFNESSSHNYTNEDFEDILIDFLDNGFNITIERGYISNNWSFYHLPLHNSKLGYKIKVKKTTDDYDDDEDVYDIDSLTNYVQDQKSNMDRSLEGLKKLNSHIGTSRLVSGINSPIYLVVESNDLIKVSDKEETFYELTNMIKLDSLKASEYEKIINPKEFTIEFKIDSSVTGTRYETATKYLRGIMGTIMRTCRREYVNKANYDVDISQNFKNKIIKVKFNKL